MKRILFLALIIVIGVSLICGGDYIYTVWAENRQAVAESSNASPPPIPPPKLQPLPDVDVLAARMQTGQDIYQKVRDEALAAYAKTHPTPTAYDDEARATLRLATYLFVWDDYYGEGLWAQMRAHTETLQAKDRKDPVWVVCCNIAAYLDSHSTSDADAASDNQIMLKFETTDYPALFKFRAYKGVVKNLIESKADEPDKIHDSFNALPDLTNRATAQYQQILKQFGPTDFLYDLAEQLFKVTQDDETTLTAAAQGISQAFDADAKDSPMKSIVEADFDVNDAWCARGSGYANTVTEAGWQKFRDRLAKADALLTDAYAKNPSEAKIAQTMLTVVLGQEEPREQMELWFSRGIQADPNNFRLYMLKRYYLFPRWYGTDEDLWNFGSECAKSENWSAKIPMIFIESIADTADRNPDFFASPDVWTPVEKVYRAYLDHYPNSVIYRTLFVRSAVLGKHWDVAKEQLQILGDSWDRDLLSDEDYAKITKAVAANAK